MNLRGQHIGKIFTFLAGLIILAHSVVTHHHHFELTHSLDQESSCESSSKDRNTEIPDSHCNAFNILISGKTINSSLNNSLPEYFSFYIPGNIVNIETPSDKNINTTIFGPQAILIKQFFFTTQSLRAPPANS